MDSLILGDDQFDNRPGLNLTDEQENIARQNGFGALDVYGFSAIIDDVLKIKSWLTAEDLQKASELGEYYAANVRLLEKRHYLVTQS